MKPRSFFQKLNLAQSGILTVIRTQTHMKVHLLCALIAILAGILFTISVVEWGLLLLSIFGVLTTECINTAIEHCVDLCCTEYSNAAKQAKDIASGAVLMMSIGAVCIGYLIFFKRIVTLVGGGD